MKNGFFPTIEITVSTISGILVLSPIVRFRKIHLEKLSKFYSESFTNQFLPVPGLVIRETELRKPEHIVRWILQGTVDPNKHYKSFRVRELVKRFGLTSSTSIEVSLEFPLDTVPV
ncbi:hypothetical protein [Leptospira levettii]|uniref:hypothetical protein n=1 Tax=Leptospira levettii TaxID=2023178 RepID=UPI000CAE9846|nr:hypothetical protein [Leptospira levettii]PJZ87351.1 hypothetical protein CH368_17300 [Leptospira levettii]